MARYTAAPSVPVRRYPEVGMTRRTRLAVASVVLAGPLALAQGPAPVEPLKPVSGFPTAPPATQPGTTTAPTTPPPPPRTTPGVLPAGGQLPSDPPVKAAPPAPTPPDEKTAKHLIGWEGAMKDVKTYYAAAKMTEANTLLKRDAKFDVSIWLMTPNMARMDMAKAAAPGKEANPPDKMIISTGKTIYEYDAARKVRTQAALGPGGAGNNLLLELMTGPSAKSLAGRFTIMTGKEDENFIILDIKPVFGVDKEEFDTLTVALCGPKFKERAYIPRMVILKRGETTETWDFEDPKVNPKGIDATTFNPVSLDQPGMKGWKDEVRVLPKAATPTGGVTPTGGIKAQPPATTTGK